MTGVHLVSTRCRPEHNFSRAETRNLKAKLANQCRAVTSFLCLKLSGKQRHPPEYSDTHTHTSSISVWFFVVTRTGSDFQSIALTTIYSAGQP
jgi:hypothetical protein